MNKHPEIQISASCSVTPELEAIQEYCVLSGYFMVKHHCVKKRVLKDGILILCLGGSGWLRIGDNRFKVVPGEIFYCPPNIEHGYGCDRDGWEIRWVHFRGSNAVKLLGQAGLNDRNPVLMLEQTSVVSKEIAEIFTLMRKEHSEWQVANVLHSILLNLIQNCKAKSNLMSYISAEYNSLDELASHAGYSKYHFSRLFKAETGRSPWQVVLERKVEQACEMLLATRLSVKEIAAILGFNHPDYFARVFKKINGVNPAQFRGEN